MKRADIWGWTWRLGRWITVEFVFYKWRLDVIAIDRRGKATLRLVDRR